MVALVVEVVNVCYSSGSGRSQEFIKWPKYWDFDAVDLKLTFEVGF